MKYPGKKFYIVKSENDDRLYRGLNLTSGIRVLLINDPTTETAAAALDVGAGSAGDPSNLPGLAHLYQRLLYLSDEGKQDHLKRIFKTYVEGNNGKIDAKIYMESAIYYFSINANKFKQALSYFVGFFNKPFDYYPDHVISNEMRKVEITELDDNTKMTKFMSYIRQHEELPQIPDGMFKFVDQLEEDIKIMQKLRTFHNRYYSPSLMNLCILGKESLDELEDLVVKLFSPIKSRSRSPTFYHLRQAPSVFKIYYVPHDAYNRLHMMFNLHCGIDFLCSPHHFLTYLLKHEGRGSLLSALKTRGWSNSIEARSLAETNYKFFIVTVNLTDEGLEHIDDIMTLYFQYLKMLKESDGFTFRRSYNEYKEIQEIKFRLRKKEEPLQYVTYLGRSMWRWPLKYVLRDKHIPIEWKKKSMQNIIEGFLSPLRMSIYIGSKKYQTITDSTEPCYNYNYKIEEVPMKTCSSWTKRYSQIQFDIPACNEFIPTTTNMKPQDNASQFPTIIKNTELLKLWHKKDDKFNEPKAIMMFQFVSSIAYMDPLNAHFTIMFADLIKESLSEYVYPAALVDLHWELCANHKGIYFKIYGLDNKQHVLLEKIIDRMINFKLNPTNFEIKKQTNKKLRMKEFEEFHKKIPCQKAYHYLTFLLSDDMWERKQILELYDYVTFERLDGFISGFSDSMHVEGLIHGNVTRAEALDIARMIENKLSHVSALPIPVTFNRSIKLLNDCHFIFHEETKFHLISSTLVAYQIERQSIKSDVLLDFIEHTIKTSCSDTLIMEKKGTVVGTTTFRTNRVQGLAILIQSQDPVHKDVEKKIHNCMNVMIDHMSEETFEAEKASLMKQYSNESKTMNDLFVAFWSEICRQEYNFNRINAKIHTLHEITLHDLRSFFKKLVNKKNPKLSICVRSIKHGPCNKDQFIVLDERKVEKIDDIVLFKQSQVLYPK